jgi:hypothetical protein
MSIPAQKFIIEDGGLGQVPPSIANIAAKFGVCSQGIAGQIYGFSDPGAMVSTLGYGPAVASAADSLNVAGGPIYVLVANPSTYGSNGSVTHTGPGTGTVTASAQPAKTIALKIVTGGVNGPGLATFQVSIGGGAYGPVVATTAGAFTYQIPGMLSKVTLAGAQTWVANDVYTIATDGTVSLVGSGPATTNVTHADSPLDAYSVLITMTTAGALGTAVFTYSMDGGLNTSPQIATPSGGKYPIPGTGVMATFAGTFTAGDTYAWTTTAASFSTSDMTTGLQILQASPVEWSFAHVVGTWSNAAAAKTAAAIADTQMTACENAYRFVWTVIECPAAEGDSTVATTFADFVSARVMVCVGDAMMVSPINGRILQRNAAWTVTSKIASIPVGQDPAWVQDPPKPLKNVFSIIRDEQKTEFLDAQRFTTLRTHPGISGYFITNGRTMAAAGSDYTYIQHRRVMDAACRIVRQAELPYLNGSMRVDPKTGYVLEKDAQAFEAKVNAKLKTGIVATGDASASSVVVNRTTNILASNNLLNTVRVTPLAYLKTITTSIGYSNPALAA